MYLQLGSLGKNLGQVKVLRKALNKFWQCTKNPSITQTSRPIFAWLQNQQNKTATTMKKIKRRSCMNIQ
jgi:hypothetical protein